MPPTLKKTIYTDAEVSRMPDCEVSVVNEWRGGKKFLCRGRFTCHVLTPLATGYWVVVPYNCGQVRVGGVVLPYYRKHQSFNRNKPFA